MKRITHNTWASIIGVIYLGLMTNLLLVVGSLPLVVLAMTTDPALSWPLLAAVAPLCAPAFVAAFATFRENANGETQVVRVFLRTWLATWKRAMLIGLAAVAAVVVLLVDIRMLADSPYSIVAVPLLGVLTVVVAGTTLVAVCALSEAPTARVRDILKAGLYLGVRRWYLSALSLIVLALQVALFTAMPAVALGLTAAPALYVAWANSRYTLRPVLDLDEVTPVAVSPARVRS